MDRPAPNPHTFVDESSRAILGLSEGTDDGLVMLTLLRPMHCPCMLQLTDINGSSAYEEEVDLAPEELYPVELPEPSHRYILTLKDSNERATAIVSRQ